MFDKFGEFDSCEELNRAAAAQKEQGDEEALIALAEENGISREDAEDYYDGCMEQLTTPLEAAVAKLELEVKDLKIAGILEDWKEILIEMCAADTQIAVAVRKKGKRLAECMAALIRYSFENKQQVSDKIVNITTVTHNGKQEKMRGPLYLGVPSRAKVKEIIRNYYLKG